MSQQKSILIIEDDEDLGSSLSEYLSGKNYRVLFARKAQDGKRFLDNQRFDIVLIDFHLDKGTGDHIIKALRGDKRALNFETPVVLISGHLDRRLVQDMKGLVQGAFVKPFELDALLHKIQELLAIAKTAA